jgi:hypothetical protein
MPISTIGQNGLNAPLSLTTPTIGGGGANFSGSTSGTTNLVATAVAGSTTVTLPATTGTAALTSQLFGVGQTVQSVSRALGTNYTNSTGRPIAVYVSMSNSVSSPIVVININGEGFYGSSDPTANAYYGVTLMVPTVMTYSVTMNGTPTLVTWFEIR